MFDTEEWGIARDSEARVYCEVVSNKVTVTPLRKKSYPVYIKVPSDLFSYLRHVCRYSVDYLRMHKVSFCLEEVGDLWYFSFLVEGEECIDLWVYKGLPGWAYRV